jgi:hypothetical protein
MMFQQNGFCNDGTYATGPGKSDNRHNDMKEKDDEIAHSHRHRDRRKPVGAIAGSTRGS